MYIKVLVGQLRIFQFRETVGKRYTLGAIIRYMHTTYGSSDSIIEVDAAVIGGSLGGVRAAISLLETGWTVLLSEEVAWIGGQLTSQAVPPDEHPWIEEFGCTRSYREFRNKVRDSYRNNADFRLELTGSDNFNPGNSSVSRLSHMPALAHHLLLDELKPYLDSRRLILKTGYRALSVRRQGSRIIAVVIGPLDFGETFEVRSAFFIDGTDQGDLLPLAGVAFVTGAESRAETGEYGAPKRANAADMQPVTWVLSLGLNTGLSPIPRPEKYDFFQRIMQPYDNHRVLSRFGPDSSTGRAKEFGVLDDIESPRIFPLWSYRRIQYSMWYSDEVQSQYPDITLLNWPQNDYFMGNIIENPEWEHHRYMARELSFSFLYWLQTSASRPDGGVGYPEIGLVTDVLGTEDGAAQFPYIREGRRIRALTTIVEQDYSARYNEKLPRREDSIGIGCYHIDLHITTSSHRFAFDNTWPFEIPLGALIPRDTANLIPASKNIGTTHLTNGSFRLHPVEWNIGEAVGLLASYCLDTGLDPAEVHRSRVRDFQDKLEAKGVELHWPEARVGVI